MDSLKILLLTKTLNSLVTFGEHCGNKLNIKFLFLTTYHLQIKGQAKEV